MTREEAENWQGEARSISRSITLAGPTNEAFARHEYCRPFALVLPDSMAPERAAVLVAWLLREVLALRLDVPIHVLGVTAPIWDRYAGITLPVIDDRGHLRVYVGLQVTGRDLGSVLLTVSHELTHALQWQLGDFTTVEVGGTIEGQWRGMDLAEYDTLPWEQEARKYAESRREAACACAAAADQEVRGRDAPRDTVPPGGRIRVVPRSEAGGGPDPVDVPAPAHAEQDGLGEGAAEGA